MSPEPGEGVALRIEAALREPLTGTRQHPFVLGLCGAQGSGKSTVSALLARKLEARGHRTAVLSLDDLYLPREARQLLAAVHPLLVTRGPPGTHDLALGHAVLDTLATNARVPIPRFDKARDTRRHSDEWDTVQGPIDVVIFEGWCVGTRPEADDALNHPVNALERDEDIDGVWRHWVNTRLGDYQPLFARIDYLVLLAAPNFAIVADWRVEQEHALRARIGAKLATMDDGVVLRFVAHYERLTRHILREMPARADLVIPLDHARRTPPEHAAAPRATCDA